ncbi:ABC transporter substrate-binding protein [Pandoraea communis]|uniref:ABC transporter substrate-binding protein n=1 Tax=Pandoraea communis TaxID=2508297 RepID=A0A5E4WKZ0_9BURK|nr:extracellular solute-binding protein [Pandoraea communis]VVE24793.1 ABC transporter substrate-binding protein [Pandoraea communis]
MTHALNRRTFLKTASGLVIAPALGLDALSAQAADACPNVVVGTWGGDYLNLLEQNIGKPIIEAAGGKVTYDSADQVARMTKLRAEKASRRGSLDVACLADLDMYDINRSGILEPVDAKLVPNLANTLETLRRPYSIPHIFSAMVIVYNPEKLGTKPDSFMAALDPKLKGKVGFSDILYNFNVVSSSLAAGHKNGDTAGGMQFLRELRKSQQPKVYPSNEAVASALKSGDIWFTCMWKARALQWKKAGVPIDYVVPKEGAVPVTFEAAVPKNSQSKPCGFNYLNAMLDPRAQIGFAETMGYAPTVKNANLPPSLQQSVGFTNAELDRMVKLDYAKFTADKPALLDFWNKEFKVGL